MAERAGGGTSLRGLRERMVAAANAIAEERRSQGSFSALPSQPSNIKSAFKPVIDGSVLKNDVKQRLAKERREEKKRQDDANKETQLLEKERKSKIVYEKQMEEKQRKLREQKEKDEQRRISAEKKRNEKLQEERERFKAALHRTLERSSRIDHQKRWSWEGSTTVNYQNKTANRHSVSTEKLEQGTSGLHKQVSSASPQNSIAKKTTEKRSSSLNRRCSKLHSSTEQVEEKTPGIHNIFQYVNMPLLKHSSDELKSTIVPHKSTVVIPPQEKVDTPSKTSVETAPKASVEVPLEVSMEAPPKASLEVSPEASLEVSPEVSVEAPPEASLEVPTEVSVEAPPEASLEVSTEVSVEAPPEASAGTPPTSVETSPEASEDLFLEASVDPSPQVSMDSSPEVSVDSSPEVSTEASSEASVEASPEANVEASPEESTEVPSEASMEAPPEASPAVTMGMSSKVKMKDSPQKSETDKQASNPITKKRLSPSQIPCYRWSSSPTSRWCSPSPISASRQIQKNRPPSPSPATSKQSTQFSFSCRVIPMQRTVFAQNALDTIGMKNEAISNTINSSETASQKDMICEESGNKSTPGPMNAEEATKILAEKRRLAREQKEKEEERLQKEMEQRKMKDIAKKADEGQQEEFSKFGDGQPPKEIKKEGSQEEQDQRVELQKSDAKIKAQEEADKRKKEHERIMLQNLQERLERKKRIEEIMKRTRRPDSNTSKATETFSNDAYEEDEADDEDESESDSDSFDDMHPSAFINGTESSTKPKTHFKNVKNTRKLVFLDETCSYIRKETKTLLNCDMKTFRQKRVKDPLNQTKSARSFTKRTANRAAKTGKAETSNTVGPSKSLHSEARDWVCDKIIDLTSEIEPPKSSIPPDSRKHHLKGPMTSCLSHQPPIDNKKISKSVSALSDM
ncbi:MAP7 domain-containing protein 3 isoform X1 [Monodon monoceros]|uniref:MAP7 domain containing 3 n=2 Tax=Monodon monoceros TaxID=40151 RepID=A0A8C6BSX3_MONMO|nr:MAP7 domain-containing protein 3 isoform X1 [Monodon monoceros]